MSSELRPRGGPGRGFRRLALAVLILIGVAMLGAIGLHVTGLAPTVEAFMAQARPWLLAAQFSLTGFLWLRWQAVVRWLARTGRLPESAVQPLMKARHRAVALVLLIQLTAVLGLPFSLFDEPSGP